MENAGTLTPEAARCALRPYTLDFGARAAGSAPVTLCLELCACTGLPAVWELGGADAHAGMELENWVEPGRPRDDDEKLRDFIVEARVLSAAPRGGTLHGGGGRGTVVVTYDPHTRGVHALP
eukprot:211947-Chlamydomonas_euryale.AAC.2